MNDEELKGLTVTDLKEAYEQALLNAKERMDEVVRLELELARRNEKP